MSIRRVAHELKARLSALRRGAGEQGAYRRFLRGEGGAIAIYFGLSAIVFVGVAGLAVDAARGYLVKARLSEAIDAAALAGGKALATSDNATVLADANAFFDANFPNGAMGATVADPVINIQNNRTIVSVSGSAVIPTTLMQVLGFNNMTMAAAASVSRATTGLDVVFSFDVSGSMCDPCDKIEALRDNATKLVETLNLPFTSGGQSKIVNVLGVDYSLLNIGIVPWSAKVNVRTYPATSNGAITGPTGGTFTNPNGRRYFNGTVTTSTMPGVYRAANSQVPLLLNPSSSTYMPGGWRGCVYARYTDDGIMDNDADTLLGAVTVGTPGTSWPGWEPIPTNEGEDYSFQSNRNCYGSYWNNNQNASVSGPDIAPPNPGWWIPPITQRHNEDCDDCPTIGIQPLTSDTETVTDMIDDLSTFGATDGPQGLFWAWEVLMPGAPFNEAVVNPPFQRAQAIVFMTDGQNHGYNGDAYHGWFGRGIGAGTIDTKGEITMPDGSTEDNNLNGRMKMLAQRIKGTNPLDPAAVKIYVIQYDEISDELKELLQDVATQPNAPYFFQAPTDAALEDAFNQIAASLSALRLVK
jgi:Flp pilus assembly protein TadG